MRVLIVAHPDDEILWFDPEDFDRIVIVFLGRTDIPAQTEGRRKALEQHPLKDRITCLELTESNYWREKTRIREYGECYEALCDFLRLIKPDSVTTHNAMGEYQHADHLLVYRACMDTLTCPVNGKDPKLYRQIKAVYVNNGAWTWY